MKKLLSTLCLFTVSLTCHAGFTQSKISELVTTRLGDVMMALESQAPGTCSNQGRVIKLDANTDAGRNMYSMLLAAKLANKPIRIWYDDSSVPDTSFPTCNSAVMAAASTVAIE